MGSFITPDPAMSGLNHYAYANSNPIKYTDPTGMWHYDGSGIRSDPGDNPSDYPTPSGPSDPLGRSSPGSSSGGGSPTTSSGHHFPSVFNKDGSYKSREQYKSDLEAYKAGGYNDTYDYETKTYGYSYSLTAKALGGFNSSKYKEFNEKVKEALSYRGDLYASNGALDITDNPIYVIGLSFGYTLPGQNVNISGGLYIQPEKDDLLFRTAYAAFAALTFSNSMLSNIIKQDCMNIMLANSKDYGLYWTSPVVGGAISIGIGSLSLTGEYGRFNNMNDFKGAFQEKGFSGGLYCVSVGINWQSNFKGRSTGWTIEYGAGLKNGAPFELHWRAGATFYKSFRK